MIYPCKFSYRHARVDNIRTDLRLALKPLFLLLVQLPLKESKENSRDFLSYKEGQWVSRLFPLFLSGEMSPASGFMTGKIKVAGDLSKALTLEAVMKASRGE